MAKREIRLAKLESHSFTCQWTTFSLTSSTLCSESKAVPIDNLICEVVERDRCYGFSRALEGETQTELVTAIQECGVSFHVWEKEGEDGRGMDEYDWTSLDGSDKKNLLRHLPNKLQRILHSDTAAAVIKIWKVRPRGYLSNTQDLLSCPKLHDISQKLKYGVKKKKSSVGCSFLFLVSFFLVLSFFFFLCVCLAKRIRAGG